MLQYSISGSRQAIRATMRYRSVLHFFSIPNQYPSVRSVSSSPQNVEQAVRAEVESKNYVRIPDLITTELSQSQNSNPFSFLSSFPQNIQVQIVDEMLQSFIPLRPRYKPQLAYSYLLSYILQSSHPLPLALAVLQRTLRSGCLPVPQTHVLLSSAWLDRRCLSHSVANILLDMQSIGYHPDCGTCNHLLSSLCAVNQFVEAIDVLKGMGGAGCIPDSNSYGIVIGAMCRVRRTSDAQDLMKQMVAKYGLTPDHGTMVKILSALRANKEIWKAVEMIEFLEKEGNSVGFESYELVVEGCLERREYVLAGKVAMGMTERGFIPYIKARQKIIEGLASIDEWKIACGVRQRFATLKS
ncbi:putative pentatricopeptide [Medicago truncatula]|uniref:PPR containing plant-like protein n=1 Tax=Medicago truncatula TaxID=3880 RepID=A0A072VM37_MEDTR|nr:pentatricopeptide repeat-containing protein At1g06270 [Medicago truncatula]XP_024633009.1 pentatricopeptide repeat-containing protein At1g06270 [Medicago truncatula]XP_039686717.1 pentatricopeptide repeat-containing protein At1g06270 [Medicago truncatula]KEH39220.1 PPR containing plant-like protein [Medicago truncatula]RHN75794.1 putative pentatricopeptide [Medicago truncatula]